MTTAHAPNNNNRSLLDWLLEKYPSTPKTRAKQWIQAGRVTVEGVAVRKPHHLLPDPGSTLALQGRHASSVENRAGWSGQWDIGDAWGAVMTDASLVFASGLSFTAFWMAMTVTEQQRPPTIWGYLFFVGQGIGLLAKGPICGVMTLFPILLWSWRRGHCWRTLWHRLPWMTGTLLMLLLAMPWYIWAEMRTPGFLDYFIIGEHLKRFLEPGWSGVKYGHSHLEAFGTIWLFWLGDVFPWSLMALAWLGRRLRALPSLFHDQDGWLSYLLWWAMWPMLFFTFSHNIIWPYVITGLPAFALLVAELCWRNQQHYNWLWLPFGLPLLAAVVLASVVMVMPDRQMPKSTQKYLAQKYLAQRDTADSQMLYLFTRYYSAEFYSHGQARYSDDIQSIEELVHNRSRDFIVVKEKELNRIDAALLSRFERLDNVDGLLFYEEKVP